MSKKKIVILIVFIIILSAASALIFKYLHVMNQQTDNNQSINQNLNQNLPINVNISQKPSLSFQDSVILDSGSKFFEEHDIYGDRIVWAQNNPQNSQVGIYLYDLKIKEGRFIATGRYPAIYKDKVVYFDVRPGPHEEIWSSYHVYLYDLNTNQEFEIGRCTDDNRQPSIYEKKVVWSDNFEATSRINLYDFDKKELKVLAKLSIHEYGSPVIFGDYVAWYDNNAIYVYNLVTNKKEKINTKIADISHKLSLFGNKLAGTDHKNLYLYDLDTKKEEIVANSSFINRVNLSENYIIWADSRNANAKKCQMIANLCNDLYLYDLKNKNGYRVTNDVAPQEYTAPRIYGQRLIWSYTGDPEVDKPALYYTELIIK